MSARTEGRPVRWAVHRLEEVDSTQSECLRLARAGAPEGTVVTARHQTGGRGRRGRSWWDAPGESLLVSVLLRPPVPAARAPQLSLLGGLAVCDVLARRAAVPARIRWPNDVLVQGRKIAGILPEGAADAAGGLEHVVLGIGINVNQAGFPAELEARATSLRLATGRPRAPEALLGPLLEALDRWYRRWCREGFGALREAWRDRAATLGQRVRTPDGRQGEAVDLDEDGALLVRVGDALERVVAGEPEEGGAHAPLH